MERLRAGLVAFVAAVLLLLGTPGFDYMPSSYGAKTRAEIEEHIPTWAAEVIYALGDLNREVREPAAELFQPVERTFRIAQSWHLYRDGPGVVRRIEIWADEDLLHRSGDPDHAWLAGTLRSRRLRPVMEATAMPKGGGNWRGLSRYISQRVLEEYPDTDVIRIISTRSSWPGDAPETVRTITLSSPAWAPRRQ